MCNARWAEGNATATNVASSTTISCATAQEGRAAYDQRHEWFEFDVEARISVGDVSSAHTASGDRAPPDPGD